MRRMLTLEELEWKCGEPPPRAWIIIHGPDGDVEGEGYVAWTDWFSPSVKCERRMYAMIGNSRWTALDLEKYGTDWMACALEG